jgi:hypothetical protein
MQLISLITKGNMVGESTQFDFLSITAVSEYLKKKIRIKKKL